MINKYTFRFSNEISNYLAFENVREYGKCFCASFKEWLASIYWYSCI